MDLVRLACVKHAASVRPEPGSNSPTKACRRLRRLPRTTNDWWSSAGPVGITRWPAILTLITLCHRMVGPATEIDKQSHLRDGHKDHLPRRTARTGVLSSLPFSRSRSSSTSAPTAQDAEAGLVPCLALRRPFLTTRSRLWGGVRR